MLDWLKANKGVTNYTVAMSKVIKSKTYEQLTARILYIKHKIKYMSPTDKKIRVLLQSR